MADLAQSLNIIKADDKVAALQGHNPLTGAWNDSLKGDFLWTNVNFGEAMPDVMTPFTWSLIQQGALGNWIEFQGQHTFGNIGGRMYFNISVMASIFRVLGKNRQDMLDMIEGTLHTSLPEGIEIPLFPSSKWALLNVLNMLVRVQWKQMQDVNKLPKLLLTNPTWCDEIQRRILEAETCLELMSLWKEEIKPHSTKIWSGVLSSANHHVNYVTALRQELAQVVGPDDADALVSGLSSEAELLASLGPVVGLSKMARGEMTRQAYLKLHGHRGPHEFEVSKPRPVEDPTWLDRQLAEFKKTPVDVDALLLKQRAESEAAWERLCQSHPRKAKSMRPRIDKVAPRARLRETTRSEFARVALVFRKWALRAGEMTELGNEVFFLSIEETLDILSGNRKWTKYLPARQECYARYKALPPYPAIILGQFDPFQWAADPKRRDDIFNAYSSTPVSPSKDGNSNTVIGAAGSAGRVEGRVRRLDGPEEGGQFLQGEILVTAKTDIAWTPLFPRAAAVVTDVGAPLSHAAIVARELGIPAVVGCGDATMRLKTGDRVHVDGGQGIVKILEINQRKTL